VLQNKIGVEVKALFFSFGRIPDFAAIISMKMLLSKSF
jgi:hypothetical protein